MRITLVLAALSVGAIEASLLARPAPQVEGEAARMTLSGRVITASEGEPVEGARVTAVSRVRRGENRALGVSAVTISDGTFRLEGVSLADFQMLRVEAEGFATIFDQIPGGGPYTGLDYQLSAGKSVKGIVRDASTKEPIEDVQIIADVHQTGTDAAGRFLLGGFEAAATSVALTASAPGYLPFSQNVNLNDPESDAGTFELSRGGSVRVSVTSDQGEPLGGVRLRVRLYLATAYSGLERAMITATTREDGLAELKGLPADQPFVVEGTAAGLIPAMSLPVILAGNAESHPHRPVELVLSSGRTAAIQVSAADGSALGGARVEMAPIVEPLLDFGGFTDGPLGSGASQRKSCDANGTARFDGLPAGPLLCTVRCDGFVTLMLVVAAPLTESDPVRLTLEPDPDPPSATIPWMSSLEEAFTWSDDSGLPVVFSMAMDGERANDAMADRHFRDPEIIRIARELPMILSNVFGEGGVAGPANSTHREDEDGLCTRYGTIPCASHQSPERYCVANFIDNPASFQVPQHIVIGPNGKTLTHRVYFMSQRDLERLLIRSLRQTRADLAVRLARQKLAPVLRALLSDSREVQERAERDLVLLVNTGDEHAVALLSDLFAAGVPADRRHTIAANILPQALYDQATALRALVLDPDDTVARAAMGALSSSSDDPSALETLILACRAGGSSAPAAWAAAGVEDLGSRFRVKDPDRGERWRLVVALIDDGREISSIADLRPLIERGSPEVRAAIWNSLAQRLEEPESVRLLTEAASENHLSAIAPIRAWSRQLGRVEDLGEIEGAALRAAESDSGMVREEGMRIFGMIGGDDARRILVSALKDQDSEVRLQAAISLASLGDRAGADLLVEALSHPFRSADAEAALRTFYDAAVPKSPSAWRAWLER